MVNGTLRRLLDIELELFRLQQLQLLRITAITLFGVSLSLASYFI